MEKPKKDPTLYDVPIAGAVKACEACNARIIFTRSPKAYSKFIPLSIDSPHAVRSPAGVVMRAPSHYTDCTEPGRFSRNR